MDNIKNIALGVLTVIVAVLGTLLATRQVVPFGASSGTEHSFHESFSAGATFGGVSATSSTAASYTTAARDFGSLPTVIKWTPNVNTTITLSSTSTLGYIPNVGDSVSLYFLNASTTAASSIIFAAADANLDLQFAEATGGDLTLNGLDWEKVTLIHTSTYQVTAIVDEMTEAD